MGIALASNLDVYVTDADLCRVQKFTFYGAYLGQWGSQGSGDGQFGGAYGVAVDLGGSVYVADNYNHRIQKFDADGRYLSQWPVQIDGDLNRSYPWAVAADPDGNIYVSVIRSAADTFMVIDVRIQKFDSNGNILREWGSRGAGPGQFSFVYALA